MSASKYLKETNMSGYTLYMLYSIIYSTKREVEVSVGGIDGIQCGGYYWRWSRVITRET